MEERDVFREIFVSFREGLVRHFKYGIATHVLRGVYESFQEATDNGVVWPENQQVVTFLEQMTDEYDEIVEYMAPLTQLIYVATLLDTLLSDVTSFMLLRHPRALGKTLAVSVTDLIDKSSKDDLLTSIVARKAREVAGQGLSARLDYLRQTFGLQIDVPPAVLTASMTAIAKRNIVVHDQTAIRLRADAARVVVSRRDDATYPTPVSERELMTASRAFGAVGYLVTRAVLTQVLSAADDDAGRRLLASVDDYINTCIEGLQK